MAGLAVETKPLLKTDKGGEGKDSKGEKPKKETKDGPQYKTEYEPSTMTAALISASRLKHAANVDDILGYIYHILLHLLTMGILCFFAMVWFYSLEDMEDRWETASTKLMGDFVKQAQLANLPLTTNNPLATPATSPVLLWTPIGANVTAPIGANVTQNPLKYVPSQSQVATYTLQGCKMLAVDFYYLHMGFLGLLCGVILNRLFSMCKHGYTLLRLPSVDAPVEGVQADDDETDAHEDPDGFRYSMRNWNAGANDMKHMHVCFKIVSFILILVPDLLFTIYAAETGFKLLQISFSNPIKLVKASLKVGFLLAIPSQFFKFFASHNMKVYLRGGAFIVPATKKEKAKDDAGAEPTLDFKVMWGAWISSLVKIVLGLTIALTAHHLLYGGIGKLQDECHTYQEWLKTSLLTLPQPVTNPPPLVAVPPVPYYTQEGWLGLDKKVDMHRITFAKLF